MPDFGLTTAIAEAVAKGAKQARVMRPAERALVEREAARAAAGATPNETGAAATAVGPEPVAPQITPETAPPAPVPSAVSPTPVHEEAPPTLDPTTTQQPVQTRASAVTHDTGLPGAPDTEIPPSPVDAKVAAGVEASDSAAATATPPEVAPIPVETQAARIVSANLQEFPLNASHMPNFDVMQTSDDVKAAIATLAQDNKVTIDEARRGVITHEQLLGLANDLGTSTEATQQLLARETGTAVNAETIIHARQLLAASADRVLTLADQIANGAATDLEKVTFARQVQLHNEIYRQFMGARAEAGRTLNALGIPVGATPAQLARMSELIASNGGDLVRMAKAVRQVTTMDGLGEVLRGGLFSRLASTGMTFVNRLFVNGILSGPVTHFVNMIGNATFQAMNAVELTALYGITGGTRAELGEVISHWQGLMSGTSDGWRLFKRALKSGDTIDGVLRYDASGKGRTGTLSQFPSADRGVIGSVIHGLDQVIDAPTRAMGAEDEWFKAVAYRADLQRQAFLHVSEKIHTGEINMGQAVEEARRFMENTPEEAQAAAEEWAARATFQSELGPLGRSLSNAVRKVPIVTLIVPFIRTPVNIFKEAAARGPLALATARFWSAMKAGGRDRDMALTRFALGSATSGLVAHYAMNDVITGAGPSDPKQNQLWQANGRRPYSIKVTNPVTGQSTWHSYARIEPMASVVGLVADSVEILSRLNSDVEVPEEQERQVWNAISAVIIGVMNNTGNKTFMKGASDFIELLNDPARNVQSYVNQMTASLVPFSSLSRTIRNTNDPYLREAWTILDKIRDNIPGYSKDLPLRLGLFGEPRDKNNSTLLGTMSPMPESSQHNDPVVAELQDLMTRTGSAPITMPTKLIQVAPGAPGLHLKANEYSDLVQLSRATPIFGNLTFHEKIEQTMNLPAYQKASAMVRVQILKSIQNAADQRGRVLLEKQNPDFAIRAAAWRQENNRLKFDH